MTRPARRPCASPRTAPRQTLFTAPSAGAFGSDMVGLDAPAPPPWIAEFVPGRDVIEVACAADAAPALALVESRTRTELRLGGTVIARFAAGTPVALSDVLLVARRA